MVHMWFSQELMSRTSLETQKLDLMDEVSFLKLKLVSMEETQTNSHPQDSTDTKQNKAEVRKVNKHVFKHIQVFDLEMENLYDVCV